MSGFLGYVDTMFLRFANAGVCARVQSLFMPKERSRVCTCHTLRICSWTFGLISPLAPLLKKVWTLAGEASLWVSVSTFFFCTSRWNGWAPWQATAHSFLRNGTMRRCFPWQPHNLAFLPAMHEKSWLFVFVFPASLSVFLLNYNNPSGCEIV